MSRSRSYSASRSRSRSPAARRSSPPGESSQKGCPFLIRLFVSKGKHAPMMDFDQGRLPLKDEFQVYAWKNSTPTSIIQLLLPSFPPQYRSPMARFSFRHIYVDASPRGLYRNTDLISFSGRDLMATVYIPSNGSRRGGMDMELDEDMPSGHRGQGGFGRRVEEKTLDAYGFVTGDFISVSVYVPEPKGLSVRGAAAAASASGGPAGPGGLRRDTAPTLVPREVPPSEREGTWARGEALPSRSEGYRGGGNHRSSLGGSGRDRDEDYGKRSMGTRGGGARRGSPERNGHGGRDRSISRSRSPARRESWANRRERN